MNNIIAVVFDFDDTLVPDSTSLLLKANGLDPKKFWSRDVKKFVRSGYDPTLAFLRALLDNIGNEKPLGDLTNQDLRNFGKTLDSKFYPGLPKLFNDLRTLAKKAFRDVSVEFYIVSGGLKAVIDGSKIIRNNFDGVYGCQLDGDTKEGVLKYIKRCVTFTEKTRYLFEINKGLSPQKVKQNPYLVNRDIPFDKRRIPFQNIIYVGDGLTDVPCFSLIKNLGKGEGMSFGIFNPEEKKSAKKALLEFLKTDRVLSTHAPKYGDKDELGSILRTAVVNRAAKLKIQQREA